jgi:hypothetical protein
LEAIPATKMATAINAINPQTGLDRMAVFSLEHA